MKTTTFILSYIITFIIIVTLCVTEQYTNKRKTLNFIIMVFTLLTGASGFTKTRAEDMEIIILLNVQNVVNL